MQIGGKLSLKSLFVYDAGPAHTSIRPFCLPGWKPFFVNMYCFCQQMDICSLQVSKYDIDVPSFCYHIIGIEALFLSKYFQPEKFACSEHDAAFNYILWICCLN